MITLEPTRFSVFSGCQRVGVVIPRNDTQWVFLLLDGTGRFSVGDTPDAAVSAFFGVLK